MVDEGFTHRRSKRPVAGELWHLTHGLAQLEHLIGAVALGVGGMSLLGPTPSTLFFNSFEL